MTGKQKRRKNWNSEERKQHLLRRLQRALDYRQVLLHSDEGFDVLRAVQTTLAISAIGTRLMWEYRNEEKHSVLGEYLACFHSYHLQTEAQRVRQTVKYIDFCVRKQNNKVETEMPNADIDLFQPTRSWFPGKRCEWTDNGEGDIDWQDCAEEQDHDDMDTDPSEATRNIDPWSFLPKQQQVCTEKTELAQARVEKVFVGKVCKMDVASGQAIFDEGEAEEGALVKGDSKAQTPCEKSTFASREPMVLDNRFHASCEKNDGGSNGGFDVNTSAIGSGWGGEVPASDDPKTREALKFWNKTLEQVDDDVSTDAGSVRTMKTISGAGSSSTSARTTQTIMSSDRVSAVIEGSESEPDVGNLEDVDYDDKAAEGDAECRCRFFDDARNRTGEVLGAKFETAYDQIAMDKPWQHPDYLHLFARDKNDPSRFRFKWTDKIIYEDGDDGHSKTELFKNGFRMAAVATEFFGAFDMDRVPKNPRQVPTLEQMQSGYGKLLPAYDNVLQRYLPSKVCIKDGKKCPHMTWYPLQHCGGLGAVFWDGTKGPIIFHETQTQTPLVAKWQMQDEDVVWREGEHVLAPMDVYEDPTWQNKTQVDTAKHLISEGKMECLVDPNDARKIDTKGHRT